MGQLVVVLFIGFVILIFVQLLLIPGLTTDVRGAYCWTVAVRPGISLLLLAKPRGQCRWEETGRAQGPLQEARVLPSGRKLERNL